jgi:3-deoxy-D-manno-octulosonic-acid transferase
MIRSLLILVYSLCMLLLSPVVRFLSLFSKKWRLQLAGRDITPLHLAELARRRAEKTHAALFFCSSAGEYEQAKPLIDRIIKKNSGDWFVHICFFSRSGFAFAKARSEILSYSLCPLDSVWAWGQIFSAIQPEVTFVVRYELWPAFLSTARHFGKLYLVNASRGDVPGEVSFWKKWGKRQIRGRLLQFFDKIFVVDDEDARFFKEHYLLLCEKIVLAGDTKYDRVRERALYKADTAPTLDGHLKNISHAALRFIVGSGHKADLAITLAARSLFNAEEANKWLLVLVPHDVSSTNIELTLKQVKTAGLRVELFSMPKSTPGLQVLIVDTIGQLAEFYAVCDAALVGGAFHHRVHNVLEPACHGLPTAFGPLHKNSSEALELIKAKAAKVVATPEQLALWWQKQNHESTAWQTASVCALSTVERLCGASNRILTAIFAD